jgi:hypothetical protein
MPSDPIDSPESRVALCGSHLRRKGLALVVLDECYCARYYTDLAETTLERKAGI